MGAKVIPGEALNPPQCPLTPVATRGQIKQTGLIRNGMAKEFLAPGVRA